MNDFAQCFLPSSFSNIHIISSNNPLKQVLMKLMVALWFPGEHIPNMMKLLTMAQNMKRKISITQVSKVNGLDKLIGRSLGESEFRSQYNARIFVESTTCNDIEALTEYNFVYVNSSP
jgi:hypothetical protein